MTRDWRNDAACREVPGDMWFPLEGELPSSHNVKAAVAICRGCPVRDACLAEAMADVWTAGIWGGLTEADRRRLRKDRRAAA